MSVKVAHLSKIYGSQTAVNDISFEVEKGEVVGFLGPNGAGKSSTLKIITGYLTPTSGHVFIENQEVSEYALRVKKKIGYLPENNPLYLDLYIQEYLSFLIGIHQIPFKERKQKLGKIMSLCGLIKESKKKITALSKGYRQRVGLAAALIHDPKVIILDEPTSGLDPNQIIEIRNLIKEIASEKTVLFSSHIMQEVQALCSRVIILNHGKIVANSSVEDLSNIKNEQIYSITFLEKVNVAKLENLKCVHDIKLLENTPNSYKITTNDEMDYAATFFDFAVEHQIKLLHLSKEKKSLENFFRELTQTASPNQ